MASRSRSGNTLYRNSRVGGGPDCSPKSSLFSDVALVTKTQGRAFELLASC